MPGPYDHIIHRFLTEEEGIIVSLSGDSVFSRSIRTIIARDIGVKSEVLFPFLSPGPALEKCLELRDNNTPTLIFVERMIEERPTTDFIIRLKKECPEAHVIVLTWEATQGTVAYFFEIGVNRVLVKPASADKLIEEMARTINPPSELKKQVDRCARLLAREDYDEALEVTDRILLLQPDSARGLSMRGDALMGIGETDKGVQSYMAAHESKPIFMEPLIKLARAFTGMDDERALSYMKQLDEISPLNPERKIEIAEQHLRRNEPEEAEAYLDRSVEVAEREHLSMVGDLTERIVDAVAAQAPNLAVKYLNRVIDGKRVLGRDDLVHFNRLGIILRGEGKWQEAIDVYEKGLTIAPEDPIIHYNIGLAYWEGDERYKAAKSFEHALELDPDFYVGSVGAALNIGSLYLDLRQFQDAESFFQHVLELDPQNHTAQQRLKDAQARIPQKHTSRKQRSGDKTHATYNMDASISYDVKKASRHDKKSSTGPTLNVDALASDSGIRDKQPKQPTGPTIDVDALGSDSGIQDTPPKKSASKGGLNVDDMFGDLAEPRRKKKKKKKGGSKVTKLDF